MSFKYCPMLYKLKYLDEKVEETESDALTFWTAFDLYIQWVEKFKEQFCIVKVRFNAKKKIESTKSKLQELLDKKIDKNWKEKKLTELQEKKVSELNNELKYLSEVRDKKQLTEIMWDKLIHASIELSLQPLYLFDENTAQTEVEIEYKWHKIGWTLDEFDKKRWLISDTKTACSIDWLRKRLYCMWFDWDTPIDKYKSQLTFYQLLVHLKHDIICDWELKVVTKEDIPKSEFLWADKRVLPEYRPVIIEALNEMIETINYWVYPTSPRSKCVNCPAYRACKYSNQTEHTQII